MGHQAGSQLLVNFKILIPSSSYTPDCHVRIGFYLLSEQNNTITRVNIPYQLQYAFFVQLTFFSPSPCFFLSRLLIDTTRSFDRTTTCSVRCRLNSTRTIVASKAAAAVLSSPTSTSWKLAATAALVSNTRRVCAINVACAR